MGNYEFRGTPGPWSASGNGIDDSRHKQVCRCPIGKHKTIVGRQWGANAQAISAVPELIEALNDFVALFNNGDLMAEDCGPEYRAACAALNKATGAVT